MKWVKTVIKGSEVSIAFDENSIHIYNAYPIKDDLKVRGYRWNPADKSWHTTPGDVAAEMDVLKNNLRRETPQPAAAPGSEVSKFPASCSVIELRNRIDQLIREGLRDIDIPITFSEETILVLMPHTDLDGIKVVADRIREHAAALPETYGVVEYSTVSIGAVCSQGAPRLEFGPLMQQVTKALREAKRAGGDQLVIA